MKPNKDGLAIILAGKAKKKPGADAPEAPMGPAADDDAGEGEMDEGMLAASEDMITAMKSGDAGSFKEALRDFMDMCR